MSENEPLLTDHLVAEDEAESPLEQLAAKRRVIAETRDTLVPVPGYDREPPLLLVKYKLLEGPDLVKIGDKISRETRSRWQRQILAAVDTFVAACMGFYVDKGDGKPVPLTYHGEPILRYDHTLAEALGFADELPPEPTARAVVFGLFTSNDAMIAQHNYLLNRWFQDTSLDVSQEMAGNL